MGPQAQQSRRRYVSIHRRQVIFHALPDCLSQVDVTAAAVPSKYMEINTASTSFHKKSPHNEEDHLNSRCTIGHGGAGRRSRWTWLSSDPTAQKSFSDPNVIGDQEYLRQHMKDEIKMDRPMTPAEMGVSLFQTSRH
ncbi:hypothetical protein Btru_012204 [Bulinus truncatus]|nr:hypothetical protein Btru_012204 [Bulinus truncatus]